MSTEQDFAQYAVSRNVSKVENGLSVTLTFAQSLDAKIAKRSKDGQPIQVRLSGKQSMRMTHHLRLLHDCILVGVGTVLVDDPRLTARIDVLGRNLLPDETQPQPIIIDKDLKTPISCKLVKSKRVWIITCDYNESEKEKCERKSKLQEAGAILITVAKDSHQNHFSIAAILKAIRQHSQGHFNKVMVEGGAGIISSFAASGLVDRWIITVTPKIIGPTGIGIWTDTNSHDNSSYLDSLHLIKQEKIGDDQVYLLRTE